MQFHHHGYVSTDPRVQPAAGIGLDRPEDLPEKLSPILGKHKHAENQIEKFTPHKFLHARL